MDVLLDIDWIDGNEYVGTDAIAWNGVQWIDKIIGGVVLSYGSGDNNNYEVPDLTVKLDDTNRKYRTYIDSIDDRHIKGRDVIVYTHDGTTGTQRRTMQIYSFGFDPLDNTFLLHLGFKLFKDVDFTPPAINDELFATLPEVTRTAKLFVNHCYGYFKKPVTAPTTAEKLKDTVKAPRVLNTAPRGNLDYLVGKVSQPISLTPDIYKPDGTVVSPGANLTLHTDGYYYVNYSPDEDFLYVHLIPSTNFNFLQIVTDILDDLGLTYDTSNITNIFDEENKMYFNRSGNDIADYFRKIINGTVQREAILKEINVTADMEYFINEDNEVEYRALDFGDLSASHTFGAIKTYNTFAPDETMQETKIIGNSYKSPATGSFELPTTYQNDDAIDRSGLTLPKPFDYPMSRYPNLWDNYPPFTAGKFRLLRRRNIVYKVNVTVDLIGDQEPNGIDIKPLDIISFPHVSAPTATARIYQVRRVTHDYTGNLTTLDLYDIEDFKNYYAGYLLLIHSNNDVDDSQQFINYSPINSQQYFAIASSTVRHNTGQAKFGASSIRFGGGALDYLNGDGNYRLEPFQYTDYVLQKWIRRDVLGVNHTFISGYVDASNYWRFIATSGNVLQYRFRVGGVNLINMNGGTLPAINTWYHVLFCKIGTDYGLYVGGIQVQYQSAVVGAQNMQTLVQIGTFNSGTDPADGWKDEICIMKDNNVGFKPGGLAPNIGVTDTFPVPTIPFNDYGLQ